MSQEIIPPVNYSGDVPCDCCGSMTFCDTCADDPKVAEAMHHELWYGDGVMLHGHLCGVCTKAGCTFDNSLPDGGEKCGDLEA